MPSNESMERVRIVERQPGPAMTRYCRPGNGIFVWACLSLLLWSGMLIWAVHFIDVKTQRVATGPAGFEAITAPCEEQP